MVSVDVMYNGYYKTDSQIMSVGCMFLVGVKFMFVDPVAII